MKCPKCGNSSAYVGIKTIDCPNKKCAHFSGKSRYGIGQTFARLPVKQQKKFIDLLRAAKKTGDTILDDGDQQAIDQNFELIEEMIEGLLGLD